MKILRNLLRIFNLYKPKLDNNSEYEDGLASKVITQGFHDDEKIARTILSPFNFKKNKQKINTKEVLNKNVFETPPDLDEVSVNRLDYTTSNHIKFLGKLIDIPSDDNRSYCGVAIINVSEIKLADASIVYSPLYISNENVEKFPNPFHSDIKIGFIKERGKALNAEFSYKISKMMELCRYYPDPNPEGDTWKGDDLI